MLSTTKYLKNRSLTLVRDDSIKDEILNQVSVFASDFAKASTGKKATPDTQDDGFKKRIAPPGSSLFLRGIERQRIKASTFG
jgi:hypothetical protein